MLSVPSIGTIVVFFLGILVGAIIANKDFRRKFFVGLRKFLAGLGQGARNYSERQRRGKQSKRERSYSDETRYHNTQDHQLIWCSRCKGTGRVKRKLPGFAKGVPGIDNTEMCPDCEGTRKVYD